MSILNTPPSYIYVYVYKQHIHDSSILKIKMIQHIVNLKLSRKQPQGGAKVHAEEQTGCLVHRSQKLAVAKGEQTKNCLLLAKIICFPRHDPDCVPDGWEHLHYRQRTELAIFFGGFFCNLSVFFPFPPVRNSWQHCSQYSYLHRFPNENNFEIC